MDHGMCTDMQLGNVYGLLALAVARTKQEGKQVAIVMDEQGNLRGICEESPHFNDAVVGGKMLVLVSDGTTIERIAERIAARLQVV